MPEKPKLAESDIMSAEISGDGDRKKRERRANLGPSKGVVKFIENYREEFHPGDEVLELGVGEGRNLEAFQGLDLKLHGIEIDPQGVEICRQNLADKNIEADIREGSFTDLSAFNNESMRAVLSQYAVQNAKTWEDIKQVFAEVRRVLKPSGLYLFREQKKPLIEDADRQRRVAYFTEEEMQQLTKQFGLEIVEDEAPVETNDDPRRVGGKQIVWNLVLRKKQESE